MENTNKLYNQCEYLGCITKLKKELEINSNIKLCDIIDKYIPREYINQFKSTIRQATINNICNIIKNEMNNNLDKKKLKYKIINNYDNYIDDIIISLKNDINNANIYKQEDNIIIKL